MSELPDTEGAVEKVLVVDDDEAGRYVKARILERAGYTILQAPTGKTALALVASDNPALVILDVKLPDMSGIDVCRHIKDRSPGTLVLQTSAAFTGKHDRAAGLVGGADSYLVEPIEPEELTATVEALLRLGRVEQKLRSSHTSLEQQVAERTRELANANLRLLSEMEQRVTAEKILRHAQKMDVLGQLTGGIAHDFNNLLAIILGNLESLRRRLAKSGDTTLLTYADNAFYGARRATTLTRQLLSFARRASAAPRPIDLKRLMDDIAGLLRQTLGERVEVETVVADDVWPIYADQGELEAALLNLAVNSRDAMPTGGTLTVSFANQPGRPGNGSGPTSDQVAITIADTGAGMSEDVIKYAFEPFFTTKGVGEGTGLGLSQVYGFTTQAGGRAAIESAVGHGTKVTLYLPRHHGTVSEENSEQAFVPGAGNESTTILVVEDNDHLRAHSVEILRELGYRVEQASTAKAALALLAERNDIKVLFSDIGLPGGMDGIALAVEAVARLPYLKVLLTTGYAKDTLKMPAVPMPVISKPFTFAGLGQKLRDLLAPSNRLLLIEDEVMIRMDTAERLREKGFEVDEAGSAGEAMAALHRVAHNAVSAVIVDIGLPDRRGDDLAAELRADHPELPVIIASGYSSAAIRDRFGADQGVAFVGKPYAIEDIERAVTRLRAQATPPLH